MLLNQIAGESNPSAGSRVSAAKTIGSQGFSGRREREFRIIDVLFFGMVVLGVTVRAAGATGFGAGTQRLVDDRLDGACTAAAFGTAAEAPVKLLGVTRQVPGRLNGIADIMVAQNITGTDDHEVSAAQQCC